MHRYSRQIALPEISLLGQEKIEAATILMVGCGGLGSAALPYLAGAGIGHIIIADHDAVDITNIHRQTIYQTAQEGENKATATKNHLNALNPNPDITAITRRITKENIFDTLAPHNINLILDGSDNFETKALLNDYSIASQTPLISASVNQWNGQIGVFQGFKSDKPCYRCLFPDFPTDARNCNEAGILGTAAGIIGLYQAHIALNYILGIEETTAKNVFLLDLKTIRLETCSLPKDENCAHCQNEKITQKPAIKETPMIEMISIDELNNQSTIIIDVRQPEEIINDPITHEAVTTPPVNIPLPELVSRFDELPTGHRLAFLCAGNIRSRQAAEYVGAKRGHTDICILDKFSL